jgi:hypothetical protein
VPALIRRRVPVRITGVADGVMLGEPEPGEGSPVAVMSRRMALPVV